jgi:hypothetical protein
MTKRKQFHEDQGDGSVPDEEVLAEGMLGSNHRGTDILDPYATNRAKNEKISVSLQFSPK